jgi:predicted Zn-dependent protease
MIVAGNESKARSLGEGNGSFAPERAARLGWWYYRAGKFDAAGKLLQRLIAQRPGDPALQTTLGWVEIEGNPSEETLQRFQQSTGDEGAASSFHAGMAIAGWRLNKTDDALGIFDRVSREAPEWTNPQWVRTLYGPVAARSAQEMYAEQQKRRLAAHKR